jgi:hypothetical protein
MREYPSSRAKTDPNAVQRIIRVKTVAAPVP